MKKDRKGSTDIRRRCCHLKLEHKYSLLPSSNLPQNIWNKAEWCLSAITPVQLLKLKWLQRPCLMLGHLFRWRSHSLLRGTRESVGKCTFVRDYCIALQRTPKKIGCSFPRTHMVVAHRVFFNLRQVCFWICWLTVEEPTSWCLCVIIPFVNDMCWSQPILFLPPTSPKLK